MGNKNYRLDAQVSLPPNLRDEQQEHLLYRPDRRCQRSDFNSLGASGRANLWIVVRASLSARREKALRLLLQASIVGLGFGMNLHEVVRAGRTGFLYTALSISFAMLLGLGIGRLFKVQHTPSLLICAGTAICGGSAIAAVGPVLNAGEEEMGRIARNGICVEFDCPVSLSGRWVRSSPYPT